MSAKSPTSVPVTGIPMYPSSKHSTSSKTSDTITDQPFSTFPTPVSITITDSTRGTIVVTTPPVVTMTRTSTDTKGSLLTTTHVIANPTGVSGNNNKALHHPSFFNHSGRVAGVFLVLGIVAACLTSFAIFIVRRRRLQGHRKAFMITLPIPNKNFSQDPQDPQVMRETKDLMHSRRLSVLDGEGMTAPEPLQPFKEEQQFGKSGLEETGWKKYGQQYEVTYNDLVRSSISLSRSSPSLYPPSPPAGDEDNDSLYEQEMGRISCMRVDTATEIPPPSQAHIKPETHHVLRNLIDFRLSTLPLSASPDTNSETPSPTKKYMTLTAVFDEGIQDRRIVAQPHLMTRGLQVQEGILSRGTLLNVRSRTSRDSIDKNT